MVIHRASGYLKKKKKETNTYFLLLQVKTKKVLAKYAELWNKIKCLIKTINNKKEIDYGKDFTKIMIYTDDELPLNKLVDFPTMTVIIRSVFEKDGNIIHKFS